MRRLALCGVLGLILLPAPAAADVLLTPFAGVAFATDDVQEFNYGVSFAFGGLIGIEVDVSQTRIGGFEDVPFVELDASATTLMGNLMVRFPAGPIQPYASGGVGLIRLSGDVEVDFFGTLVSAEAEDFGMNVGGGLHIFPTRHIGIRGDVRYFRTFGDLTLDTIRDIGGLDDLPLPSVDFWRVTGGVTIRF
jgi:opacity protein-like surface antigen